MPTKQEDNFFLACFSIGVTYAITVIRKKKIRESGAVKSVFGRPISPFIHTEAVPSWTPHLFSLKKIVYTDYL